MKLYCATSNPGKLREFRLVSPLVEPLPGGHALEPCEETGVTFEANAILKAEYYSAALLRSAPGGYLFADDSGLEVEALGGAPSVYSARFAGPDASDEDNNRLLLERLTGIADRRARFVCVIALAHEGKLVRTFRGAVRGEILESPRGPNGFGYDPIFFYPPFGSSFGEVESDRKFQVSHRGQALSAMLQYLTNLPE